MFGLFTNKPKFQEGTVVLQGEDPKYAVRYVLDTAEAIAIVDGVEQPPKPMHEVPFPTGWGKKHLKVSPSWGFEDCKAVVYATGYHHKKVRVMNLHLRKSFDDIQESSTWNISEMNLAYVYLRKMGLKLPDGNVPFPLPEKEELRFYRSLIHCGKAAWESEDDDAVFYIRKNVGWDVSFFAIRGNAGDEYSKDGVAKLWNAFWTSRPGAIPVIESLEDNATFWKEEGTTYLFLPPGGTKIKIDAKGYETRGKYLSAILLKYLRDQDVCVSCPSYLRPGYLGVEETTCAVRRGLQGVPYTLVDTSVQGSLRPDVLPNGRVSKFDQFYE